MIKATVKLTMAYKRKQLAELKDEDVGKLLESFAKVHLDKIYPSRRTRLYVTTLGYKVINFITKTITITHDRSGARRKEEGQGREESNPQKN